MFVSELQNVQFYLPVSLTSTHILVFNSKYLRKITLMTTHFGYRAIMYTKLTGFVLEQIFFGTLDFWEAGMS